VTTLYGIKNCDTIRKARRWLDDNDVDYSFHDVRTDGLDKQMLQGWEKQLGWEQLLNRRGTTWRGLPNAVRDNVNRTSAVQIMLEHPAIIKRPLLVVGKKLYLGFSTDNYREIFD
jgi:Spx/MgsR family transcriptional regulator